MKKYTIYQSLPYRYRIEGDQYVFHLYSWTKNYNYKDENGNYPLGKNYFEG